MNGDVTNQIRDIQVSMVEPAKSCFDKAELGDLRALIRLTVEFHDYVEHGSVQVASGLFHGPDAHRFKNLQSALADPFNKYDLDYACESIRSGVDSFCNVNRAYRILAGATDSKVEWGMISSRESFKEQFVLMFMKFAKEENFENRCRLLLDLFKLQIVFAGASYG